MKKAILFIAQFMAAGALFFAVSCNSGPSSSKGENTDSSGKNNGPAEDTIGILNPIPDSIRTSDLVVGVDLFAQVPPSSQDSPVTRIIKLDYQPGTNDLFVQDLRGKLFKLVNRKPELYMDIKALEPNFILQPGLATGFGSFAFHPNFRKNGLLYTAHSEPAKAAAADFNYPDSVPVTLQWVVTEWKTDAPGVSPFTGKARELFRINMPTGIHGMQEIAFDPKSKPGDEDYGLLYIGIGDGGSVETYHALVSDQPTHLWGTILRIDPAGRNSKNGKYGIPEGNPFAKSSQGYAPEIYAYGFRNPHRFNWTKKGKMLAINIGQHHIESVNLVEPGHFYGWPVREGDFLIHAPGINNVFPLPADDSTFHVTYPVAEFDHDEGKAISGGFEYQGNSVPQLEGKYVFGDIGTGILFYAEMKDLKQGHKALLKKWNISEKGKLTSLAKLCHNDRVDMRVGMDGHGELYLFTKWDGKIYKLVKP